MTDSPQKILYLITKSNLGGAQKYVLELATEAKRRGHAVSVACGGTGKKNAKLGGLVEQCASAGITVYPIKHFRRDMALLSDFLAFIEVWRLLLKEHPDVLHVTSSKAGGIGTLAGRLAGIKRVLFTSHGLTMDERWRPKWQQLLISWFTWLTIRMTHHSIMISTETYDRVRAMLGLADRVSRIFNGVTDIPFRSRTEARKLLVPDASPKITWIGGVGELHPNKNWHSLINALPKLPNNVHVVIIGEGQERDALETQIQKMDLERRVHLVGYRVAAPLLKAFDVFVLPSLKEGLPYVLLEASLAELPIIASDLPGNHDIIESGQTGLLVEPTPITLAMSLQMLLKDSGMRSTFGQNSKAYVQKKFSQEKMFAQTFACYSDSSSVTV